MWVLTTSDTRVQVFLSCLGLHITDKSYGRSPQTLYEGSDRIDENFVF